MIYVVTNGRVMQQIPEAEARMRIDYYGDKSVMRLDDDGVLWWQDVDGRWQADRGGDGTECVRNV